MSDPDSNKPTGISNDLLARSLGGSLSRHSNTTLLGAGVLSLALVVGAVSFEAPFLWAGSLAVIVLALVHASSRVLSQNNALLRSELKWIETLPFDWNRSAYLEILSTSQRFVELRLTVRFANFDTYRSTVVRDLATVFGDLIVEAQSSESICIRSPILRGYGGPSNGPHAHVHFNNQLIHVWFKNVVNYVLLRMHQEHPIESLVVSDVTPSSN